ncbi:MAG: precorrin-8X methylmutase [Firmicutes bacterium HGW-Firmicutes-7]|nr:MAG: precorrin-8X methylmutase [Firmicutes bacterium HGW-Firmicutes-7]
MNYQYIEDPMEIERRSFEIIHEEMRNTQLPPLKLSIMKRVIHTSTDFIYEDILLFKEDVENLLLNAFIEGCTIVTDTEMIKAGISKKLANQLGIQIVCFVGSQEAMEQAKSGGVTRSMAAVDIAIQAPGKKVFVVGNAPTALYRIMEWCSKGDQEVEAVIGVPVGFVGAAESKEALWEQSIPSIVSKGRKGGSTIAVAIINAVMREAVKNRG